MGTAGRRGSSKSSLDEKNMNSAWHAHGNPDDAAIELNYKTLAWH